MLGRMRDSGRHRWWCCGSERGGDARAGPSVGAGDRRRHPAQRPGRRGARVPRAGGRVRRWSCWCAAGPSWRATAGAADRPGRGRRARGRRVRRDPGRRDDRAARDGCWSPPASSTSCPTSPACGSAGATTCCTARTATAGRCATSRSGCSPRPSVACTRRCCSGSGPTTWCCSSTPRRRRRPSRPSSWPRGGSAWCRGVVVEVLATDGRLTRRAPGIRGRGRTVRAHGHAAVRRAARRARRSGPDGGAARDGRRRARRLRPHGGVVRARRLGGRQRDRPHGARSRGRWRRARARRPR